MHEALSREARGEGRRDRVETEAIAGFDVEAADADDARRVAGILDIPFYVLNFQDDFGRVIDYFVSAYAQGFTPNPCLECNRTVKFRDLFAVAKDLNAAALARAMISGMSRTRPMLMRQATTS